MVVEKQIYATTDIVITHLKQVVTYRKTPSDWQEATLHFMGMYLILIHRLTRLDWII